ncbi:uncharacterized protein LOC129590061 isoform X2 [Paramacrobiotus metropolitanus]|uniref:uncharacterized protein LOC129590061 isoform X2 n=1 Tax=Paramacrobiotus metropolitanus TaxID=2943436 RepID=UPI00244589E9|nr:uncharacterized protein LOC129590061 isoform X2 [Paramacrobiotus metropolitanus]
MDETGGIPRRNSRRDSGRPDAVIGDSQPTEVPESQTDSAKKTYSVPASQFARPAARETGRYNGRSSPIYFDITSHQELPETTHDFRAHSVNEFRQADLRPLDLFMSNIEDNEPATFLDMSDKSFADLTQVRASNTAAEAGRDINDSDSEIPDNTHLIRPTLVEMAMAEQRAKEALREDIEEVANPLHDIVDSLSRLSEALLFRPAPLDMFAPTQQWDYAHHSQYEMRENSPGQEPAQLESWSELSNAPVGEMPMEEELVGDSTAPKFEKPEVRLQIQSANTATDISGGFIKPSSKTSGDDAALEEKPNVQLVVAGETKSDKQEMQSPSDASAGVAPADDSLVELMKHRPAPLPLFKSEPDSEVSDFVDDIEGAKAERGISDNDSEIPDNTHLIRQTLVDIAMAEQRAKEATGIPSETVAQEAEASPTTQPETEKSVFQKLGDMILHPIQSIVEPAIEMLVGPISTESKGEPAPGATDADFKPDSPSEAMLMGTVSQQSGMLLRDMPDSALTPHSYEYCYPRVAYSEFLDELAKEKARREAKKLADESESVVSVDSASVSELQRVGSGGFEPSDSGVQDEFFNAAPDLQKYRAKIHAMFPKKDKTASPQPVNKDPSDAGPSSGADARMSTLNDKSAGLSALFSPKHAAEPEVFLCSMSGHMHPETDLDGELELGPRSPSGHELCYTESVECLCKDATEPMHCVHSDPSFESKSATFIERSMVSRQPFGDGVRMPAGLGADAHLARIKEIRVKSAIEKAEALLATLCGKPVAKDSQPLTLGPYNCHTVESAEVFERLMQYGADPQDMSFDSKSQSLMHEFESSLNLPSGKATGVSDQPGRAVKKRRLTERLSLFFEEEKRLNLEDAEILMRQDMYQEMSGVPVESSPVKRKSGFLATIRKLFRRKENGKKEANSARSSEQDVATSAEALHTAKPGVEEDIDDLEPLGMPLRSCPAMISFPNLVTLHLDDDTKRKRKSVEKLSSAKPGEFGASWPTEDASTLRSANTTSEASRWDRSAVGMEPGMTDSVQIDRTGIAHMDLSYYEPSNHSGDAGESGFRGGTVMPGGPSNLPIDMDAVHPFKKVMEYGGLYEDHCSIILFWACYLPSRLGTNYTHTMEHLYRYVATCLDLLADKNYKLVFFNGATAHECEPPLPWLRDVFALMNHDNSKKMLEKILIVHPDDHLRNQLKFIDSTGFSKAFTGKIEYVNNLASLEESISPEAMEFMTIPDHIRAYDTELANGVVPPGRTVYHPMSMQFRGTSA